MMKISKFLLLSALLLALPAMAKDVVVEASGYGITKDIAIESALVRAISQVKGVDVSSHSMRVANQVKLNDTSVTAIALANTTAMKTKGQIKSFEVLESSCDDGCEVLLSVVVPVYESPGKSPKKRRKLVVSPFAGPSGKVFSDNLQALLVQSRRFAVLDREHDKEYAAEKRLLLSSDTALEEKMRLGQVLGLDYLIVGDVKFYDDSRVEVMSFTGETDYIEDYYSQISYKVINLATRQVKWQDISELGMDIEDQQTASMISRDIINAIYPIKVVANTAGAIVLNQGGKSVMKGEIFDVFVLGEKIIDPYTKESLGRIEIPVGQIEISRITPKMSYGRVIDGSYEAMEKGSIVRLAEDTFEQDAIPTPVTKKPSSAKASSSGGILFPAPGKKNNGG